MPKPVASSCGKSQQEVSILDGSMELLNAVNESVFINKNDFITFQPAELQQLATN